MYIQARPTTRNVTLCQVSICNYCHMTRCFYPSQANTLSCHIMSHQLTLNLTQYERCIPQPGPLLVMSHYFMSAKKYILHMTKGVYNGQAKKLSCYIMSHQLTRKNVYVPAHYLSCQNMSCQLMYDSPHDKRCIYQPCQPIFMSYCRTPDFP